MAVVETALQSLWAAVNELSRVRPEAPRFRVTVYGSARIRPGDPVYDQVRRLCARLAARGCDIVTGGGPGLMQAANEGAQEGDPDDRTRSVGVRVHLPFEQGANPFVEKLYTHQTFFTRLHHFVRLSDAFVVFPGGIGTTLEMVMVWQLLQVRHLEDVALVLVGEMWRDLVEWARRHMISGERRLASPGDLELVHCVADADAAAALVEELVDRR
jgi:uncharacterized protein (TIGR00730 family)